jgi:flavin-dependent dehydrogenase
MMTLAMYDVVVVGAGCAGLTAAIGLARAGFSVAVVEAGKVAGGSGLLGGVCFADNLIQPDILGIEGAETLPWERRLIERGSFATDGRRLAGTIYRDADAFFPCYTILRSRFSPKLAEYACTYGATLRMETAVESLIRDGRRIIGVATTDAPLYARLVFLAEGDAGYLVRREGLDRASDPRDQPAFLYCLQQVLELPPGAIEERFGVGSDQAVAYDLLLRNPASLPLNVRGQLCTNQQGLTLSIVLPASNLHRWFNGEPRQLLDWFLDMPVLRRWLRDSQPSAWTAALLRAGSLRDVPYLIEDGLVVGGAAAGLGVDFPVMNLLGPAMATGLMLSRGAARIRSEGLSFDRDALSRHYLEPLQQTRYWRDMEYVQRWPGYRERAHVLFGHGLDLLVDSASVWARPRRWLLWKCFAWLRVLAQVSWGQWNELRDELLQFGRVLRLHDVTQRPALARLLLDGSLNAFRDLAGRDRPHLPRCGTLRLHYHSVDEEGRASAVPWLFRRWFERFRPVLAAVGRIFYANDDSPLSAKINRIFALLLRQINLFDLVALAGVALPILILIIALFAWNYVFPWKRKRPIREVQWGEHGETHHQEKTNLVGSSLVPTSRPPRIRIAWHSTQPKQQAECVHDLPHICPSGVFELTDSSQEAVRVTVHSERCISCHACWRLNSLVDWGRNGVSASRTCSFARKDSSPSTALRSLLDELELRLWDFDLALDDGPALVGRPHNDFLEMLARYAQQLTYQIRASLSANSEIAGELRESIRHLADALVVLAEERTRHAWESRFAWAAANGRLIQQHYLTQLRRLLAAPVSVKSVAERPQVLKLDWIPSGATSRSEDARVKHLLADIAAGLYVLKTIENAATAESVHAELLSMLVTDLRDRLAVQMQELETMPADKLSPYTRKIGAATWQVYSQQGQSLLKDLSRTRRLLDVPGDWSRMEQLRVLRAEFEELADSERRLLALASDWCETDTLPEQDDVSAGFGHQVTLLIASKLLLLQTFAHLEKGNDAQLAILLLRVWLDHSVTLLDEYTIIVRERLQPATGRGERPLVEPDSGPPLRTQAEYLTESMQYHSGDFLLFALDLLQPRLAPEMVGEKEIAVAGPDAAALVRILKDTKQKRLRHHLPAHVQYLIETLTVETIGRYAADSSELFDLEGSCTRLVLMGMDQSFGALRERCVILRALAEVVIPRLLGGGVDTGVRHLHRDALALESLKADFRRRLEAVWQVFGESLGRDADVQASCFALAEVTAWLKAAESTLGRMAWISRLCQAEDREEPSSIQDLARHALKYCFAEIRDHLLRFDEDLASLRRGYYSPHVYAAAMLLRRVHPGLMDQPEA